MAILNLASLMEQHARRRPDRVAVIAGETRFTYGEMDAWANRIAGGLQASGIRPGDHVGLLCPNLPYFPAAYFGILKTGATVVPLNAMLTPREIAYHLRDSDAKALFCFEGTAERPMAEAAKAAVAVVPSCERLIVMPREGSDAFNDDPDVTTLAQLTAGHPNTFETAATSPEDTAVMLYTSGTTGQAKGAELTHLNMVMNAMVSADVCVNGHDENGNHSTAITLPLFHATAQTVQMNAYFYLGGSLVLLPRFDPSTLLAAMLKERVTHWIGVPTMYWSLMTYVREHGIDVSAVAATLKLACSGGAPMPVELLKDFQETFRIRVTEGYGLSEVSPVACINHLDRPAKPGTVGQPLFSVDVMCVDEHDRPVAAGQPGEVVIRGHNVMKGYYKQPEATAEAMRNGWFHTGDIGTIDSDGYVSIIDRKKDMILRGGFNVYPRELEEILMTHPAVSLAAVIGVPDERLGEEVKAVVVRKPSAHVSEDELRSWCKAQFASYKYPRLIEFRTELPTSATGKILKRELRVSSR
jgi:long-chain acyl-CoA synthetase